MKMIEARIIRKPHQVKRMTRYVTMAKNHNMKYQKVFLWHQHLGHMGGDVIIKNQYCTYMVYRVRMLAMGCSVNLSNKKFTTLTL